MKLLINLDVDDLEKAIRFYGSAFGLKAGRRFGDDAIEMLGGPCPINLLAREAGTAVSDTTPDRRKYSRHWTPLHLDFVVEEIESAAQRAVSAGAILESPIASYEWGRIALMADPFGHGFCLLQFLGQEQ